MFGGGGRHGDFNAPRNPYRRRGPGFGGVAGRHFEHLPPWKQQLFGLVATLATFAVWYATPVSDWITDIVLQTIPLEEDIKLGVEAQKQFQYMTIHDSHWTPIVQSVGRELIRTYNRHRPQGESGYGRYRWDFAVIDADAINAFALPGGTVRVTQKLLRTLQLTQGELAALLGHEVGHVVHRHSQARMLQQRLLQRIVQALVYEERDGRTQETFGQALGQVLTKSASWLGQQKFSRRDEYEADATSWELLLVNDRYNPQSLHSLLSKLQKLETTHHPRSHGDDHQGTDSLTQKVMEWSQTHPATKDRLHALRRKWDELPARERRRLSKIPV